MYRTDLLYLGIKPQTELHAMIAAIAELFPDKPIVWIPFDRATGEGGVTRVTQDHIIVRFNLNRANRSAAEQLAHLNYVFGHELGHVIVKGRGAGVYLDFPLLHQPESKDMREPLSWIVSALEHPAVHSVMREYGMAIRDEIELHVDALLRIPLGHLVGMEDRLSDYSNVSAVIDLVGLMTAFNTNRSEQLFSRIQETAPALAVLLNAAVRQVERFAEGLVDAPAAGTGLATILGHAEFSPIFVGHARWLETLPPSGLGPTASEPPE